MSTPKRHHFVPQMLLRNFTDDDGQLWYFDKTKPNFRPVKRHPRTIFFANDYYSIPGRNGDNDTGVERELAKIEQATAPIIEKICTSVRKGLRPGLTRPERHVWSKFVFTQWKRTPDSLSGQMQPEEVRQWVWEKIYEAERSGIVFSEAHKHDLFTEKSLARVWKGVRARNTLESSGNVEAILNGMGLCFVRIPMPGKAFIIGSAPVVKLNAPGKTQLGEPNVELWLPISSDIVVSPMPGGGELVTTQISDVQLRNLNLAISNKSQQIGAKSKQLLQSLVSDR